VGEKRKAYKVLAGTFGTRGRKEKGIRGVGGNIRYTWEKRERHKRCWREYPVQVGEKRKAYEVLAGTFGTRGRKEKGIRGVGGNISYTWEKRERHSRLWQTHLKASHSSELEADGGMLLIFFLKK
jgi:hypothetical protein